MKKNIFRVIFLFIIIPLYYFFILYLSIKNELFKGFVRKFIALFKNREIGEGIFIIVIFIIPVYLIIQTVNRVTKR